MKRWPLVVVAAVAACGSAQNAASRVAADAGRWLVEAGESLQDAGAQAGDGAQAQASAADPKSGSRIEMRVDVLDGDDGSRHPGVAYAFDTKRGERCSPGVAADGKVRCLPAATTALTYFADSRCERPVLAVTCEKPKYMSIQAEPAACAGGAKIFAVGDAYAGDLYTGSPSSCELARALSGAAVYVPLGSEIAASEFVLLSDAGHVALD
jgi:hypothetical protein